jgi:hypothetical protein
VRDGYDYICTYVDNFKIVARDPDRWKTQMSAAFLLKSIGPPTYYLGNDFNFSVGENAWAVGCAPYITVAFDASNRNSNWMVTYGPIAHRYLNRATQSLTTVIFFRNRGSGDSKH